MMMMFNPKCGRLGCPEQAQTNEFFCPYHRSEWDQGHVTPTIYYDGYYYFNGWSKGATYETKGGEIRPILDGDTGLNGMFNGTTRRYDFMSNSAYVSPPHLGMSPVANPLADEDLEDDELAQVDRARVLGTALRRFIDASGIDDPYVLAMVLDYVR